MTRGWSGITESFITDVRCRVIRTTNQSIPNNSNTDVLFTTDIYDPYDMHDTSSNTDEIVIPSGYDGFYLVNFGAEYAGDVLGYRFLQVTTNNAETNPADGVRTSTIIGSTDRWEAASSTVKDLVGGDIIRLRTRQTSGSSLNLRSAYVAVTRIGL